MATEIERLILTIESDLADLVKSTNKEVDRLEKELRKLEKTGTRAAKNTGQEIKKMAAQVKAAKVAIAAVVAVIVAGAGVAIRALIGIGKESKRLANIQIRAEKQLEAALASTNNQLGLSVDELKRMAGALQNVTNFGDETIIAAQALLVTFTKIGKEVFPEAQAVILDVATAMGTDLKSATIQVGKALNDPIAGISALSRSGIQFTQAQKDLIKELVEGGRTAEAQAIILKELNTQFGGSAAAAREADGGVKALANALGDLGEELGRPIGRESGKVFKRLNDVLSSPERNKALAQLAKVLGEVYAQFIKLSTSGVLQSLEDLDPEVIEDFANAIEDAANALGELTGGDGATDLNDFIDALTTVLDLGTSIVNTYTNFREFLGQFAVVVELAEKAITRLIFPILNAVDAIKNLVGGFEQLNKLAEQITGDRIANFSRDLAEATETEAQRRARIMKSYRDAFAQDTGFRGGDGATTPVVGDEAAIEEAGDRTQELLESLADDFLDLQAETNRELEQNEADHLNRMVELNQEFINEASEARQEAADELLDLERDVQQSRAEIFADTRADLAKLEQDTDRQLAKVRQDGNLKEARQTEDHIKDLRRLRMGFLDNLEDAVGARDAGRVRDLQRQFARESQERTDDFQTTQSREKQDRNIRLDEIRQSESIRSAAILAEQTKRLEAVRVMEMERRTEIAENLRLELVEIEMKKQEAIRKEEEEHLARQTELENAMRARLQTLALELAAEDDITTEGARTILGTYANFFGEGGEIDKLMEAFSNRQRQRMRLALQLPSNIGGRGGGGGGAHRNRQPPGQVQAFSAAQGGSIIARQPTVALFGEAGPELAEFTPLNRSGSSRPQRMQIEFSGSAPPGIRGGEIEQIAAIINRAFREAGA